MFLNKMKDSKLIILRGPSGSGKSTVAKKLFEGVKRSTVLLQQDHYRFIFTQPRGLSPTGKEMIFADVRIALKGGYDVILEGIFTTKSYTKYFEKLVKNHPNKNYMFYFDISFEETLRRHATRKTASMPSENEMRGFHAPKDYSKFAFEHIIPESSSLKQTVETIKTVTNF